MSPKSQDDDLVMTLVEMALRLPTPEQRPYVERACSGDSDLLNAVWNYVECEQQMSGFLLEPVHTAPKPEGQFSPGDVLESRFRIVREVAQGGMGIVYEAIDERLDRRIALKCAKPGFHNRLPPEVRNASDISHPNVCKLFEIHTASTREGNVDFLTMEFLDGETLSDRLRRGSMPEEEARTIALQLCSGLAEAHRRQVIHGDLKTNNVILTRDVDGGMRAVITDFGLARKPEWVQSSRPGSQVGGTPDYMAPELWRGAKPSGASDIYALGVILKQIAAAQASDQTNLETVTFGSDGKPPVWHRLGRFSRKSSLRLKWGRVVDRCLEAQPERRFASAAEIAEAITPRRQQWLAASAAAAVLAVASALATYETATAPPQSVSLVALPFQAAPGAAATADRLFAEVSRRITKLRGDAHTSLLVLSPSRELLKSLDTPAKARATLGATHVLRATVRNENDRFVIQAQLMDARSLANAKQWRGVYMSDELKYAPVALAGMVTEALHVPSTMELAGMNTAARQDYVAGVGHLRRNSEIDLALPLLEHAVLVDPDSALTHAGLAEARWWKFFLTKDPAWLERAKDSVNAAERRNPDVAEVRRVAGLIKANNGWYEQAEVDYLRAIELQPGNSDAYRRLGSVYEAINDYDKALGMYRRAVEIEPDYYRNHQALGNYYRERADYREALKHFQKTVELEPREPVVHFLLGFSYYSLGQWPDAENELRLALDLGETADALEMLGMVLTYERRDQESIAYYKRALTHSAGDFHLWMNLGTAFRRLNLDNDSKQAYRHGLELAEAEMGKNPRDGYVRGCLAYLAAWLGDRSRAESEVAQALQLAPINTDTRRMAIKTYEALGRRDEALSLLSNSPPDVLIDLSRYPDLADLQRDPRFVQMLASIHPK